MASHTSSAANAERLRDAYCITFSWKSIG